MQGNSNIIVVRDEDMQALKVIQKFFIDESQYDRLYMLAADVLQRITEPVKKHPFESERDDLLNEIIYLKGLYDKVMQEKQELEKRNSEMQENINSQEDSLKALHEIISSLQKQLETEKQHP